MVNVCCFLLCACARSKEINVHFSNVDFQKNDIHQMISLYRTLLGRHDLISLLINLVSWLAPWLTCWLAFLMIGKGIAACFLDWLAAWLVGWLVVWLIALFVDLLAR